VTRRSEFAILIAALFVSAPYQTAMSAEEGPGPIPPDGPLARPKSLQQLGVPVGATRAAAPPENPQTREKVALGEKLFFDGRLSVDGTVACSTCHDPARAFTDGRAVSIGVKGRSGQRNSPTILNAL
jgi:cytochrome c peroxidase